jgi:hypothetical protein
MSLAEDSGSHQPSVPPTTTHQEDLTTLGQRKINLIWEYTQAAVAIGVIALTMIVDGGSTLICLVTNRDPTVAQMTGVSFVNLIAGIVISFYFSRTNYAAIGGIGAKPEQMYEGR